MGWRDTVEQQRERMNQAMEMAAAGISSCPDSSEHYVTEVNRGSIRMQSFGVLLNERYTKGYRLAHAFEQDGNTVMVFEHNHP